MTEAWARASSMMYGLTAAYAPASEPTVEELKSELAAAKVSHGHANRALTNMAVTLSDVMDHVVELQERERKTKLKQDARCAGLAQEILRLGEDLTATRKNTDALEKRLTEMLDTKRTQEKSDRPNPDPLFVTHLGGDTEPNIVNPEWCVVSREKDADGKRDVIGFFHNEAAARWFAERWQR